MELALNLPMLTDKEKITAAFKDLRKKGYVARQNYMCCGGCASYGIAQYLLKKGIDADKTPELVKAVFYHQQDNERAFPPQNRHDYAGEGMLSEHGCYLNWQGDANEIIAVLNHHGLQTQWDGDSDTRILILGGTNA